MRNQIFREGFDCGYKLGVKQGKLKWISLGFFAGVVGLSILYIILLFFQNQI